MSNDNNDAKKLDQEVEEVLGSLDEAPAPAPKPEPKGASVVQLHNMQGKAIRRGVGRPKKPDEATAKALADYHEDLARRQAAYVESDPLVQATQSPKDSAEMLRLIRQNLARVQATLDFRRIEDEKFGGKESREFLGKQSQALREIAAIELKIKEMGVQNLDLYGEQMQKVFTLLIGRIQTVASEVLPKATFDLFFNRLGTALQGWEEEADSVIR